MDGRTVPAGSRRARRRFDTACAGLAAAILVVGGTGVYVVQQAGQATEVDYEDVLADFRAGDAAPAGSTATTTADPAPGDPVSTTTTVAAVVVDTATVASTAPAATAAQPNEGAGPPPSTAPAPAGDVRPAEGVYRYAADGGESVSMAGGARDYPDEVFAIVRHTPCGMTIEVRVLEEHLDRTELCQDGTTLSLVSEFKEISFFGQRDDGEIACDPPMPLLTSGQAPGQAKRWDCTAGRIETTGTVALTGGQAVDVGGRSVEGSRVEWRWNSSGQSTGHGVTTWVFDASGLPLRIERENENRSQTVLGNIRYQESVTFVLQSLDPQR